MTVFRSDSQQTSCSVMVMGEDGVIRCVATASCHVRPGKNMTFSVDVLDEAGIAANLADVEQTILAFMAEEYQKAKATGVPIVPPVMTP